MKLIKNQDERDVNYCRRRPNNSFCTQKCVIVMKFMKIIKNQHKKRRYSCRINKIFSPFQPYYKFRPSCPSSSSSVRPPSRPSVAVVRRCRPLSVRPSRPSVAVVRRRQVANPRSHAHFRKKTSKYESYSLGTMKFG